MSGHRRTLKNAMRNEKGRPRVGVAGPCLFPAGRKRRLATRRLRGTGLPAGHLGLRSVRFVPTAADHAKVQTANEGDSQQASEQLSHSRTILSKYKGTGTWKTHARQGKRDQPRQTARDCRGFWAAERRTRQPPRCSRPAASSRLVGGRAEGMRAPVKAAKRTSRRAGRR